MTAFNVAEGVVAVVEAENPDAARDRLRTTLALHGFDLIDRSAMEPHLGAFVSEPDSPAHELPAPCRDGKADSWAEVVADFKRWGLTPWQAQNMVRLAACAVDSGEIRSSEGPLGALHGFSDPDELEETARRAWAAIRYLGDGEPAEEPEELSPVARVMSDPTPGPWATALIEGGGEPRHVPSSRRTATELVPVPRLTSPLAQQLVDWAKDGWDATAYLTTGAVVFTGASAGGWTVDVQDRMLMFFGDGGTMHLIDPATVYAVHLGPPADRHDGFTLNGAQS